ncbi:684_t:CDS:1, partial [Racocetra fulgida]
SPMPELKVEDEDEFEEAEDYNDDQDFEEVTIDNQEYDEFVEFDVSERE